MNCLALIITVQIRRGKTGQVLFMYNKHDGMMPHKETFHMSTIMIMKQEYYITNLHNGLITVDKQPEETDQLWCCNQLGNLPPFATSLMQN